MTYGISRRKLIEAGAALGGSALLPMPSSGRSRSAPPASAGSTGVPNHPVAGYRDGQPYLFQSVAVASYPFTLGGGACNTDTWGPTQVYVDFYSGWRWRNRGGDWIDREGVAQGPAPWFSADVNAASGKVVSHVYEDIDVTDVVSHCQRQGRWLALLMRVRVRGARCVVRRAASPRRSIRRWASRISTSSARSATSTGARWKISSSRNAYPA